MRNPEAVIKGEREGSRFAVCHTTGRIWQSFQAYQNIACRTAPRQLDIFADSCMVDSQLCQGSPVGFIPLASATRTRGECPEKTHIAHYTHDLL